MYTDVYRVSMYIMGAGWHWIIQNRQYFEELKAQKAMLVAAKEARLVGECQE